MSFSLSVEEVATLLPAPDGLGHSEYAANIALHWPLVSLCLSTLGVQSDAGHIGALATIRVECPPFKPVKEYGGITYLNRMYDTRTDLGNTPELDGDGALYAGRGFAQLTGKSNYRRAGEALGVDLVRNPDLALEANINASIFAWFYVTHHVGAAAEARDWVKVRKIWNGGTNGLNEFLRYVRTLEAVCNGKRTGAFA